MSRSKTVRSWPCRASIIAIESPTTPPPLAKRPLDRLQVRKDFHPRSDPIQGGKLELFVQVFFLFFLYGSDNAKKSVGLVADPGREIKSIIKKVESPKSVEI
jgi:hypothetical protein